MAVKDYNTDPDLNTTISGINIAEGCPPSGINNAIRQLMADVKAESDTRALDASVVHKTGEETIAGSKTFTSSLNVTRNDPALNLVHSAVTQGTKPTNTEYWAVNFKDSAGTNMAKMAYSLGADLGNGNLEFTSTSYNGTTATLRLRASADGTTHLFAPSTPAGAAENEVVTVDYLAGADANLVHKTGNETISGAKTFTADLTLKEPTPVLKMIQTDMELGGNSEPTSPQNSYISFLDKNEKIQSTIYGGYSTSGNSLFGIQVYDPLLGSTSAIFQVIYAKDGQKYAIAPTTPTGSTSNQIVTANYLNSTGTYSPGNLPAPSDGVTTTNFDTMTTPGRYHVRYTNATVNVPMAVNNASDGILEVDRIGTATSFPSARLRQKFHVFGGLGNSHRTFMRICTLGTTNTWREWVEVMTSNGGTFTGAISAPTPAATANDTKVATTAWVRGKGVLVESWHSGANWYRKYSDGWIEQGGRVGDLSNGSVSMSFYIAFADTNYNVMLAPYGKVTGDSFSWETANFTTSGCDLMINGSSTDPGSIIWHACGYSKE